MIKLSLTKTRAKVNLNGDDQETLTTQWRKVFDAANDLKTALGEVTVHGRNYQTTDTPKVDFDLDREARLEAMEAATEVAEWAAANFVEIKNQ